MRKYRIELNEIDLGQVPDGLETRAVAWEKTAAYHRTGQLPTDILIEECRDAEEAEIIASHYRSIIENIRKQQRRQS